MFRMAFLRHPVFQGISASLHVNGHDFSSRQIISTCIPAGNVTDTWPFFDIHVITALVHPCPSMCMSDDVQESCNGKITLIQHMRESSILFLSNQIH